MRSLETSIWDRQERESLAPYTFRQVSRIGVQPTPENCKVKDFRGGEKELGGKPTGKREEAG